MRYNCSSAVTCLLYAALQTANEPSGSINRSPNGSIKARYGTLSCIATGEISVYNAAAKEAAQMFAPPNVCTSSTRYVYAMPQCRPLRYVYIHRRLAKHRWRQGRDTAILPDVTIWRLTGDVMMENARGNSLPVCSILFLSLSLKCHRRDRSSISIFFAILCTMH